MDLERRLNRKDDSQYGVAFVSVGEASRMVIWAKHLLGHVRRVVEAEPMSLRSTRRHEGGR